MDWGINKLFTPLIQLTPQAIREFITERKLLSIPICAAYGTLWRHLERNAYGKGYFFDLGLVCSKIIQKTWEELKSSLRSRCMFRQGS